jgi:chromosome segregation ATPase
MTIVEALEQMDLADDSLWTNDGLPLVHVVQKMVGHEVTRQDITDAKPNFNRGVATDTIEQDPTVSVDAATDKVEEPIATAAVAEKPIATEKPISEDERLAQEMQSIDDEINELVAERDILTKEIDAFNKRRDTLQGRLHVAHSPKADLEARLVYIKRQQEIRVERARRGQQFLATGLRKSDIDPRAPIDSAMARKTRRGTQRPNRTPMNQT